MQGIHNKSRCDGCGYEGYMAVNDTLNDITVCESGLCDKRICYANCAIKKKGKFFCEEHANEE